MNRYDYQKELAKAAGAGLAVTTIAAMGAAVVVGPSAFAPVAYLGITVSIGGLLVGDLAIRTLTPDPFEEARERYEVARERFEGNQSVQHRVPEDMWRSVEITEETNQKGDK